MALENTYEDNKQNRMIREHLADYCSSQPFNKFVTVSFDYSRHGTPLWKSDVAQVRRLIETYAHMLSKTIYGRRCHLDNNSALVLAVPEYKKKNGDSGHLHYHILAHFPETHIDYLTTMTLNYWSRVGNKYFGCSPTLDVRDAYHPSGSASYSLKHLETGFTLENAVITGLV